MLRPVPPPRLALNIKKIPFDTVWLLIREVEAKAKEIGAKPTHEYIDGRPCYVAPLVVFETGDTKTALAGSNKIARYLDEKVPEPPLFRQEIAVIESMATNFLDVVLGNVRPVLLIHAVAAFDQVSADYFKHTRKLIKGSLPFKQLVPQKQKTALQAKRSMFANLDGLATHFDLAGRDNFRITPEVSYVEIKLVAMLHSFRAVAEHSKAGSEHAGDWVALAAANGGRWRKLMEVPEYREIKSVYVKSELRSSKSEEALV